MIFRFYKVEFVEDCDAYDYDHPEWICAHEVKNDYDTFYKLLMEAKDYKNGFITLKDECYEIEDIFLQYGGDDNFLFTVDVYCSGWY